MGPLTPWTGFGAALAQTAAGGQGAVLSTADFVRSVGASDAFEQRAGKVAQVMGASLEVRRFSRDMVDQHARSSATLADTLSKAQIPAPAGDLAAPQSATVRNLYSVPAKDFDRTYIAAEIDSHQRTLQLAQSYAEAGDNPAVKQIAVAMIPNLQRNLDTAKVILGHVR